MKFELSNAFSNVIKALKLIGKDFIEMYLHFHVNLENYQKKEISNDKFWAKRKNRCLKKLHFLMFLACKKV